ncbi:MAG TPA: right-handed parallel beta-helix repeat-containing protein [Thermoanaerobaculia bacterium]|nr:right-handed parallel beta-helix repeat-containing protein [Thermoanaerobaculia bacterium]
MPERERGRTRTTVAALSAAGMLWAAAAAPSPAAAAECTDVRSLGAAGDGAADDGAALQRAIDAVPAEGGTVCLPAGTYRIARTLRIGAPDAPRHGVTLEGRGAAAVIQSRSDTPVLAIEGSSDVSVRGLRLEAAPADPERHTPDDVGVLVTGSRDIRIAGNEFLGFAYAAVRWRSTDRISVVGNRIEGGLSPGPGSGSNFRFGVVAYRSGAGHRGVTVEGNRIRGTTQAIVLGDDHRDVRILGNLIDEVRGQHGIHLGAVRQAVIAGNRLRDLWADGIKVHAVATSAADGEDIRIEDNTVRGCPGTGIAVLRASGNARFHRLTVAGNRIEDVGRGIAVHAASGVRLHGNRVVRATGDGIALSDSSGTVADNHLAAVDGLPVALCPLAREGITLGRNRVEPHPRSAASPGARANHPPTWRRP